MTDGDGPARDTNASIAKKQMTLLTTADGITHLQIANDIAITIVRLKPDAARICESPTSLNLYVISWGNAIALFPSTIDERRSANFAGRY